MAKDSPKTANERSNRADQITREVKAIVDGERAAGRKKTAHLREQRLAKEAAEARPKAGQETHGDAPGVRLRRGVKV
jgi:hypothetical protein